MSRLVITTSDQPGQMTLTIPESNSRIVVRGIGAQGTIGPPGVDGDAAVLVHIADETPHPVYDEGPSLFLLYENAKV